MAFISKSQRILPGSLNFAAPGDKLPAADAIANVNCRVDTNGSLRGRLQESGLSTGYLAPIVSLWIYTLTGNPLRYIADAGYLRRLQTEVSNLSVELAPSNGQPIGFANYQGFVWALNRAVAGRDNPRAAPLATSLLSWVPAAPTIAVTATPTAGTPGLTGAYEYFCSFYTADGFESNISPTPAPTTDAAQANNLTTIAVSVDPTVIGRYIYRSGGGQDQLYQVAKIPNNVDTTLNNEQLSDLAAAELGITHTLDHDPPPAALGMAGPYYESLFAWNTVANPNRLFWSKTLMPGYWPGARLVTGNHVDVGDDSEGILRVTFKPNMAIIYKERSVWRLRGDPTSGVLEQISTNTGLVGMQALCSQAAVDYYLAPEGIYVCDGNSCSNISDAKMLPLFKGDLFNWAPLTQEPHYPINTKPSILALATMGARNGRVYLSYADSSSTALNATLVFHPATDRWASDDRQWTCYFDEGPGYFFVGARGIDINNIEGQTTGGTPVQIIYASHFDDQGAPRFQKLYGDLEIEADFSIVGDKLAVTAYYNAGDYDATSEVLGNLVGGQPRVQVFPFSYEDPTEPGSGSHFKNISIGLQGTIAGVVEVFAFHLKYQPEQRDAKTFDTNAIQLFAGSFGQALEFELQCQSVSPIAWTLFTDIGGEMQKQASGTIAAGTFTKRRSLQIPFGRIVEGRLFRLLLTTPGVMQIYDAVRFYGRRLGVLIPDGGLFTTRELDFSTKRIKLFRRLDIKAQIDGTFSPAISTDAPRGWHNRVTLPVTTTQNGQTSGECAWTESLLPANTRGRLLRIDATSAGITRLYAARLWGTSIGEAGPSQWRYFDIPLEPSEEIFKWISTPVDAPTTGQSAFGLPEGG